MEWSFKYIGPKTLVDERDCAICSTVARKRCSTHPSHSIGCPHCDAVRDGICLSHCGLELALAHHVIGASDPLNFKWVSVPSTDATRGRMQERRETPDSPEKQARIRIAAEQFAVARQYLLAQSRLLPGNCPIEVTARGDDLGDKLLGVEINFTAFPGSETETH